MTYSLNNNQDYPQETTVTVDTFNQRINELKAQVDIHTTIEQGEHITLVSGLSQILEDTYNIYCKTHNCRWQAAESLSDSLDELLENQYTEMTTAIEDITARIRALGIPAPDPHNEFLRLSSMAETAEVPIENMIYSLITGNEQVSYNALLVSEQAEVAGYSLASKLLTERSQIHQQNASLLRNYING